MEDKVQVLLDEVLVKDIKELSNLPIGSDERTNVLKELSEIHKMKIEEVKTKTEGKAVENETMAKTEQVKSQNLDRWINVGLQAGLTIGSWVAFTLWQGREQRFELTGTPTTPIFKGLLSRMIPSMKK